MIDDVYTKSSGYPASWSDPALLGIFKVKSSISTTASTASPTSLVSSGSPTSVSHDTATNSRNIKIIIPSVIVGAALLALFISIDFCLRKRSNKLAQNEIEPEINESREETWNGQELNAVSEPPQMVSNLSEMAAYSPDSYYEID